MLAVQMASIIRSGAAQVVSVNWAIVSGSREFEIMRLQFGNLSFI